MTAAYQEPRTPHQIETVPDELEAVVREGARRMLAAALDAEVTAVLVRGRHERGGAFRGYRNGAHAARQITVGVGAVDVRVPRVADVPAEVAQDGFQSRLVRTYQRALPPDIITCWRGFPQVLT